jgi:phenylglyoxylate dehydrogenase epsilon subunit
MIDYLIAGASHAALAAVAAIRMHDPEGSITVLSKDDALPYSPTVLPYVVSGRSQPGNVALRDDAYFSSQKVDYLRGRALAKLDAAAHRVRLSSGEELAFGKLLLATGATPLRPPIPGLDSVGYHVLRTLSDAQALRDALPKTGAAVVLGGGLIGMHAAENLAKAGVDVTVVELRRHVLPGYFDADASHIIEAVFSGNGVRLMLGSGVVRLSPRAERGAQLVLDDGTELDADLLLVATGVAPAMDYLDGSGEIGRASCRERV